MLSFRTLVCGVAATALLAGPANAVTLYSNDFDAAETYHTGVTGGFSGVTTLSTALAGAWNADGWSGAHINNRSQGNPAGFTTLTLNNLATHSTVTASFLIGLLDSWDSNDGAGFSPDELEIWIDGAQVATMTTNTALGGTELLAGGTKLYEDVQIDAASGYYSDVLVDMASAGALTFAHTASSLTIGIRASGAGWQGLGDEGWGIDKVQLTYDGVRAPPTGGIPEPATWALMIGGFGMAGATLRRRRSVLV
jgi:hypothetical protein